MTMEFELLLLCALIFIFLVSFCGLLQKIRQSYERERILADRILRRRQAEQIRNSGDSFADVYVNTGFVPEGNNTTGIFPNSPPPYSQYGPPPKYDDIIKDEIPVVVVRNDNRTDRPEVHSAPPPYTISISPAPVASPVLPT